MIVELLTCVGATLSKGLNRGLGTIMAATLGLMIDYFANFIGPEIEPYVVGCSIFFIGVYIYTLSYNPKLFSLIVTIVSSSIVLGLLIS